jgi:Flp pilus assembly protein TadG
MMGRLSRCQDGAAAAEMAMVLPLLTTLLFGSMEFGHYFWHEHVVVKAVRDGARFAARQPITEYVSTSTGCVTAPSAALSNRIRNLVRTGSIDGSTPRLSYWAATGTVTVTVTCTANAGGQAVAGIYSGIEHAGVAVGAPVVTVTATVPYRTMFGMSFGSGHRLTARQQATVTGV